jgi:hypothetical protein
VIEVDVNKEQKPPPDSNTIYSAPVSELGSTANLNKMEEPKSDKNRASLNSKDKVRPSSSSSYIEVTSVSVVAISERGALVGQLRVVMRRQNRY